MITLTEVQFAAKTCHLEEDALGRIRFREDLPLDAKKRALKSTIAAYRRKDVRWRFLLGNMVNDLKLAYGAKKAYCIEEYGEQVGMTILKYAWVAAQWQANTQEYDWAWSYYALAAALSFDEQNEVMNRHGRRALTLENLREYCRNQKGRNATSISSEPETGRNSTLSNTNTTNVEFSVAIQAVRYAISRADAVAYRDAASQRVIDFDCEEETDRFAEE